jgi:4-diphosphocytidyl-2-C-methyl-D-erythritol kinase
MFFRHNGRMLTVHTPAKVNLFLEILGKRPDGYHELETLMVSVGLYDTLCFAEEPSQQISLRLFSAGARSSETQIETEAARDGEIPGGTDNLIVRAAELLREHAGVRQGVRIGLFKRIPVAAGLAGGSSDAAATLAGLNRLWRLQLADRELHRLASQLGSDVNFFLAGAAAAVCRGRGERVEPLHVPLQLHFVIVRPGAGLATGSVFRRWHASASPHRVDAIVECLKAGRRERVARHLHNALQPPAESLCPEVTRLREVFSSQPVLGHMMSGSGTSYFGLCNHRGQALQVAARLRAARVGRVSVVSSRS